jgi:preprotein translocase subunit SecF
MEFIKPGINIDFIGKRRIAFIFSGALIAATIILLIYRGGVNLGVDFAGGIQIRMIMDQSQTPQTIKDALKALRLEDSIIQELGTVANWEYIFKIPVEDKKNHGS